MKSEIKKRPFGIQWHITDQCDQRCKHCYIYGAKGGEGLTPGELSFQEMIVVLNNYMGFCNEHNLQPSISLTGGDPLLSPSFWKLAKEIHLRDINVSILGNPFHLNGEICERLYDVGCRSYQMSLDGLETTHDSLRKPGSFKDTLRAIDLLKKSGIRVDIMSTVSKLNSADLPELAQLCVTIGVNVFTFARYVPTHDDLEYQFTPEEYKSFLTQMWDILSENANETTIFPLKDHLWNLFLYEKGMLNISDDDMIIEGCSCAIQHIPILPDGTIYACRRFKSPIGNAFKASFTDIFFGQQAEVYRQYDQFETCSKCELLKYCRGCPAVSYGTSGNFYAKDPQCWKSFQT